MSYIPGLNQSITYWAKQAPDGFGGYSWTAPTTFLGRWETRTELFIDPDGNEKRSRARVFVPQDVEIGGYVYLGTSAAADPLSVSGAYEIREFRKTPSVDGTVYERHALL